MRSIVVTQVCIPIPKISNLNRNVQCMCFLQSCPGSLFSLTSRFCIPRFPGHPTRKQRPKPQKNPSFVLQSSSCSQLYRRSRSSHFPPRVATDTSTNLLHSITSANFASGPFNIPLTNPGMQSAQQGSMSAAELDRHLARTLDSP